MNVENFLSRLSAQTAPAANKNSFKPRERVLEKISLNFEGNFGMYQVLPVNSVVIDYPFIFLPGTREIMVPRKNVAQDGTESIYNAWIKLLPKDAYQFLDLNGRVTSSLTAEEDQLLSDAYTVFDQLYNEIDARNNLQISRDFVRKRNYTIFNAYCCNYWGYDSTGKIDIRNAKRSKFSGLFVTTAKSFVQSINDNIDLTNLETQGDASYLTQIYSRQASGRGGYLNFTIGRNPRGIGYQVNASHKFNVANQLAQYVIDDESMEMMKNPVYNFLGWQANREDEATPIENRRLFNAKLIQEAVSYMTKQLAAIRLAKENNQSLEDAIKATSESVAIENNSSYIPKSTTNDPMLKSDPAPTAGTLSKEEMQARNTNPYQTPASAHVDPLTGSLDNPSNNNGGFGTSGFGGFGGGQPQSAPFQQPSFAKFGNPAPNGGEGDLPF